jgi:hypothetical protein
VWGRSIPNRDAALAHPTSMFRDQPWRARELCADFCVLDEWTIPVDVARSAFPEFIAVFARNGTATDSTIVKALFALRFAIGKLMRWDAGPKLPIPGCAETTLAARLSPADTARNNSHRLPLPDGPVDISPIYWFDDEALIEISNKTIHAALHLGWIPTGASGTVALTVLTKSRGRASEVYLALIWPFRHAIVYRAWFRTIRRAWEWRGRSPVVTLDLARDHSEDAFG